MLEQTIAFHQRIFQLWQNAEWLWTQMQIGQTLSFYGINDYGYSDLSHWYCVAQDDSRAIFLLYAEKSDSALIEQQFLAISIVLCPLHGIFHFPFTLDMILLS